MPRYVRSPSVTVATLTVTTGPVLLPDGTAAAPALAFTSDPDTGFRWSSSGVVIYVANTTNVLQFRGTSGVDILLDAALIRLGVSTDTVIARDAAADTLALKRSTNAQTFSTYGSEITAGTRYSRLSVKHATTSVTAAVGATVTATSLIPAKANVLGVNTVVTTGLGTSTGTTGYAVGDGTDANRWGDVVGTAAGTDTDQTDATADPTGWFTAANNVVLTAAGGNFDGTGVILIDVAYTMTEAQ